ncbi:hypothetical protein T492DRAFT_835377 [Pavlovales sp. CCMP2436]|nr:hypothetical protein T492DRAFT_835377 [Pavlovales sp. CCMP2436]
MTRNLVVFAALAAALVLPAHGLAAKAASKIGGYPRALAAYSKSYGKVKPGTWYFREPAVLQKSFKELARIYGEETAAGMVEAVPGALTFNPMNFAPTLEVFSEQFGSDAARGMIIRNPGLLVIPPSGPSGADKAPPIVLPVSYIVAATRPVGGLLLFVLFVLLGSGGAGPH